MNELKSHLPGFSTTYNGVKNLKSYDDVLSGKGWLSNHVISIISLFKSCYTFANMGPVCTSGLGGWFDLGTMPRPSPAVESLTST